MLKETFISLFLEHIEFQVKNIGCIMTKIYALCNFNQEPFKQDLVIMNNGSRQHEGEGLLQAFKQS